MTEQDIPHLDPVDVAAYVEGSLSDPGRARVLAHLADCADCRTEIAAVRDVIRVSHRRASRWWMGTAAAAVLAGVVLARPLFRENGETATFREGEVPTLAVTLTEPPDTVPPTFAVPFAWRSLGASAVYTLTLMDETGTSIGRIAGTRDTSATIVLASALDRGATYLYTLDARLADGRVATSGTHRLHVSR